MLRRFGVVSGCAASCLAALAVGSACSGQPGDGSSVTYCDVEPIVLSRCVRCHQDPPENGAPFSLLSYADTQQTYAGQVIYQRMATAVDREDMPPVFLNLDPPVEDISEEQVSIIDAWAAAGGPSGGCD